VISWFPKIAFTFNLYRYITVQRHARGMAARKQVAIMRMTEEDAVMPIQRRWRLTMLRRAVARRVLTKRVADRAEFKRLQSSLRRSWPDVASGPRVIIHIPSISVDSVGGGVQLLNSELNPALESASGLVTQPLNLIKCDFLVSQNLLPKWVQLVYRYISDRRLSLANLAVRQNAQLSRLAVGLCTS
jgi:hypothetical protein